MSSGYDLRIGEQKDPFDIPWADDRRSSQPSSSDQLRIAADEAHRADIIQRLEAISNEISKISKGFSINVVPLKSLCDEKWELNQSINIAVEFRGEDDFVACFYEADVYGYGDSVPEALEDLRAAIINQYEFFIL